MTNVSHPVPADAPIPAAKQLVRKMPAVRSAGWLLWSMIQAASDTPSRAQARLERDFATVDHLGFARPCEQKRFAFELEMLQSAGALPAARALEVGCAEAMFTIPLAARTDSLVAVDASETALRRARQRCAHLRNVKFDVCDLRRSAPSGSFDLIVAVGVLEYMLRPGDVRRSCDRLIRCLAPQGWLLVATTVGHELLEQAWWGRFALRGTWINRYLCELKELEIVSTSTDEFALPIMHSLYRRR